MTKQLTLIDNDFTIDKRFVLGGKAVFTVSNNKGQHYTYLVQHKPADDKYPEAYFVRLLTGPDNMGDYTYLGKLDQRTGFMQLSPKSKMNADSLPVKVVRWALARVIWPEAQVPEGYGIHGEGRCGRCGHPLTHPDGVSPEGHRFGFGPTCWAKLVGG